MKKQENLYRVTYKNGNVAEWHEMSLILEDGKLYQASKMHPFDNVVPSVIDGSMIEKIECVEKNNHWDDRARLIQSAKNYPSAKEFINETGWEDWMYDVVDCPDDEDLTDSQIEKINSILYEIYEEANN